MKRDCPLPFEPGAVQLAHGGGARATRWLLETVVLPSLGDAVAPSGHDASVLDVEGGRLAFTTDAYVVRPLEFPGGDIGSLCVAGTVNDLAMAGATPLALSLAFVLEEGLDLDQLARICRSIRDVAQRAGVTVVTGDLKVVERGKGDGMYVSTSGIGRVRAGVDVHPRRMRAGDAVLVSGDVGRHGIALLAARERLALELPIVSDCAPVASATAALLDAGIDVHVMRDPTRGGLSATLNELALETGLSIELDEEAVPVVDAVRAVCELAGLDVLDVASEGRFVAVVPESDVERAFAVLARHADGTLPARIGRVLAAEPPRVVLRTRYGARRIVEYRFGELLPRIC